MDDCDCFCWVMGKSGSILDVVEGLIHCWDKQIWIAMGLIFVIYVIFFSF